MKTTRFILHFVLLWLLLSFLQGVSAYKIGSLPKGAKTFLGDYLANNRSDHGWPLKLIYSSDGSRFAVLNEIGVFLYDAATYKEIALLTGHADPINSIAFSPDSRLFASASWDVRVWDAETGEHRHTLTGHSDRVHFITFSPDGKTLASASWDIRLWDIENGKHRATLTGHEGNVYSAVVAFSPDGKTLAGSGWNSKIRLWDTQTGENRAILTERTHLVNSIEFSPDGEVVIADLGGEIRVWRTDTYQHVQSFQTLRGLKMLSPDGWTLACWGEDTIQLWNPYTNELQQTLTGHTLGVTMFAFSPDRKTLASRGNDRTIRLWDVQTGKVLHIFEELKHSTSSIVFSPDGETLATSGAEEIRFWDIPTRQHSKTLTGHTGGIRAVAFASDNMTLASANPDETIWLGIFLTENTLRLSSGIHKELTQ